MRDPLRSIFSRPILAAGLLAAAGPQAHAGGFQLFEQSVGGLGSAYAGMSASAEDVSTIFYNPAGLTRIPGTQVLTGLHMIALNAKFDNKGSTASSPNFQGTTALLGTNGSDAGETGVVPNLYIGHQLSNNLHVGLGINVPFGLKTKYTADWVGRYHAIRTELKTVNINPAVAYKFNSMFSVGIGANAQYADADLTKAIDFGARVDALGGCPPPPAGPPSGFCAQALDGRTNLSGDDWAWGYNVGLLMELSPDTRLGLSYRSKLTYKIKGDVRFDVPVAVQPAFPFTKEDASADLDLPETVSLSAFHQMTAKLALLADITWTKWDRFKELRVTFDNAPLPDDVTPEDWNNSFRYSLGANYRLGSEWLLRTGGAYDETPIPSAEKRTPRIAESDRFWLAFGITHTPNKSFRFDFSYAHLFVRDAKINNDDGSGHILIGNYKNSAVDIFSGQMVYSF
jgi:long-chain fatty acid transport protein